MGKNMAKNTVQIILLGLTAILFAVWGVTSAKIQDLSPLYTMFIGLAIGIILIIESGIMAYFRDSKYKTINWEDAITFMTAFMGGTVILSSLRVIPFIEAGIPNAVKNFLAISNIGISVIAVIFLLTGVFGIILRKK